MEQAMIAAEYASVVEDEGQLFVGFAQGEDADEPYALFRQPLTGGPVWFEISDETFGALDAVASITFAPGRITVAIKPDHAATFGYVEAVTIEHGPDCDSAEDAVTALRAMFP